MEKEVKVRWKNENNEWIEVNLILTEISCGDDRKAKKKSIIIQEYKGEAMQFRDNEMYELLKVLVSIKNCPFDKTIENIDKIHKLDYKKLYETYAEINEVSEKDRFRSEGSNI